MSNRLTGKNEGMSRDLKCYVRDSSDKPYAITMRLLGQMTSL